MKKMIYLFITLIIFITLIFLYSRYIGTTGINIHEYKIKYNNLSDDFYGLKIVHITDIHYGRTTDKEVLNNLVEKINLTKPDIVVLTGDLLTNIELTNDAAKDISDALSNIEASIGKYAIKGDNDLKNWDSIIEASGFNNISNSYDLIYTKNTDYIFLAGLDSNITNKNLDEKLQSINEFLNNNQPNYSILLMHEADFIDKIDYSKFNLVLAGHSLNGQVRLPFIGGIMRQNGSKKYLNSYYKLKNTEMYISNGIGTYKYSFRLNNRPSFNLYRLTNK